MPSLRETQRAFASAVMTGDSRCMNGLVIEAGLTTEERLRIYRNNARIGFCNALKGSYPVIEKLGGIEWFESVAQRYQQFHPSRCGDLQYVGDRFPQFLRSDLAGTHYEWFGDVAQLEWAYQEALVAPASPILNPAELANVSTWDQQRLVLVPRSELRLVESTVPILAIWKANQPGSDDAPVSLDAGASRVLLLRRVDYVELREVSPAVATLIGACMAGATLFAIQQQLTQRYPTADFSAALRSLALLQAFSSFWLTQS
jgi:hypothetical protein